MPGVTYFKPAGIPLRDLEEVQLRWKKRSSASKRSGRLRSSTWCRKDEYLPSDFSRVLASARKKIADALLNGKAIRIEAGTSR